MAVFIALLIFFYASHSWLASQSVKDFALKRSDSIFKFYRLCYTLFSVLVWSIITWLFIYKHSYIYLFTPMALIKYGGILLSIIGLMIVVASVIKYGVIDFTGLNAFTGSNSNSAEPVLNTAGMNSIVRHPIYTGILLALLGLFFILPTQMTLSGIIISVVYLEIGIRLEEKKLEQEFGGATVNTKRE